MTALATFAWVLGVAVVAPAVFGRGVLLAAVGGGIAPAVAWGHGYLLGQCLLAPVTLLQARLDWPVHGAIAPLVAAALGFALARRAARAVASPAASGMAWTLGVAVAGWLRSTLEDMLYVARTEKDWSRKVSLLLKTPVLNYLKIRAQLQAVRDEDAGTARAVHGV